MSAIDTKSAKCQQEGQFEAGVGRIITVELLAAWNTQLRQEASARCPVAGCGITFHSAPQIQSHYVTCSGVSSAASLLHCDWPIISGW